MKGQASGVFNLLIGAVLGLMIFAIIMSLIQQADQQKSYLNNQIFIEQLKNAVKNPIGSDFKITKIPVREKSVLTKEYLANITGNKQECFELYENNDEVNVIYFKTDAKVNFIINCIPNTNECNIFCKITVVK